jgi:uncharacterized protein
LNSQEVPTVFRLPCLLVLATTLPVVASEKVRPIRVLIVTGCDYPGHLWRETTPVVRETLEKDPRFEVRIMEDPEFLDSAALANYDVVFLHFMNWERPAPGEKARANLASFVSGGKGLFLFHFACGAFDDWPEFANLAGRIYDKKNTHDPRGPFQVTITDTNHPVTKGMQSFEADDELYVCLTGERKIDVLATARSKVTGKDHPMAFAFEYGKGRVFHSPLGHDPKAIRIPGVGELIRRGCAWTAGRQPTPE